MKLKVIATGVALTAATLLGAATANASDVEYRGESTAVAICRAIVEDNPSEVKANLDKAARENPGVLFTMSSKNAFQCNGKSLEDFAEATGSGKALAYLDGSNREAVAQN